METVNGWKILADGKSMDGKYQRMKTVKGWKLLIDGKYQGMKTQWM